MIFPRARSCVRVFSSFRFSFPAPALGAQGVVHMATQPVSPAAPSTPAVPYVLRVLSADSTKKGAAAAIAGILVAVISEAIWPSP